MERKNIWNLYSDEQISELKEINDKYKRCLDAGKTERECVELSVNMARDAGYRDLEEILRSGETLKAGDKVYAVNMNKMLALFRIGERPISEGMNILGAHIDSPYPHLPLTPVLLNRLSIPNDAADIPLPRTKRQNLHLYEKSLFPNSRSPPLYLII